MFIYLSFSIIIWFYNCFHHEYGPSCWHGVTPPTLTSNTHSSSQLTTLSIARLQDTRPKASEPILENASSNTIIPGTTSMQDISTHPALQHTPIEGKNSINSISQTRLASAQSLCPLPSPQDVTPSVTSEILEAAEILMSFYIYE